MLSDEQAASWLLDIKNNKSVITTKTSTSNTESYGTEYLGRKVKVYWSGDKKWYKATIIEYAVRLNCEDEPNYHIIYDDDDEDEWIHLHHKNVVIL